MKKRFWSILLVLCMVLTLLPFSAFAAEETDQTAILGKLQGSYAKQIVDDGSASFPVEFDHDDAFMDTGWGDDEYSLHVSVKSSIPASEVGFLIYDGTGAVLDKGTHQQDLTIYVCLYAIEPEGYVYPSNMHLGQTLFLRQYAICGDTQYLSEEYSFQVTAEGSRFIVQEDVEETPIPDTPTVLQPMKTDGTFKYFANHLKNHDKLINTVSAEYTYHYDESWFENSASTYQHDLARMSLRMSMAGMAREDSAAAKNYANIKNLLTELEFTNLKADYPKPEVNSIGYYIGSKNLKGSDGKVYSLVSVTVRSAQYFDEWGGNVTLGQSGNHKGFQIAADKTVTGIKEYINENKDQLTDNIKIWITGYSRGAATANLAAAKLNEVYGKNNVFAYCFECPMGANVEDAQSSQYNNIFCIVNPIDLVPKVAMSSMGFSRYGNTHFLPSSSNTALYSQLKDKMGQEYAKFLTYNGTKNAANGVDSITKELPVAQSYFFDHFVNTIARNLGGRNNYYKYHESKFAPAVADLFGKDNELTTEDYKDNELTTEDYTAFLKLVDAELLGNMIMKPSMGTMLGVEIVTIAVTMRYAHYPELCLAWLDSLDGKTLSNLLTGYRTIYVNCPVDVSVYDSSNTLAAKIVNDEPQTIENGISAFIDENGQKVFVLPMDMQYTIDVQATDDGTMTYTAVDYDMDSGAYTQVVSYADIPIQNGDQLKGSASKTDQETAEYTLKGADGKTLSPSVKETDEQVQVWSVTASAESGGTAEGGGMFVIGEYAKVTAAPESGYRFIGWYDGKTKVSGDSEYRFAVEKDTDLTAKFEKASSQTNPFKDVKKDAYYYDPVLWAVNHDPQITAGTAADAFSPNNPCTRGQIVTFLWRAKGCPEPTITKNPFTDVKASDYFYKAVLWAVEKEITAGTSKTTFSPAATVTRAQTVTFLWRAEGKPAVKTANPFKDVPAGQYYTDAVLWAVKNEITAGTSATTFSPANPCTRAQIVTFLYRDLAK